MINNFREALRQAPPQRVVALSSVGAQQSRGLGIITGTHLLEAGLADLPLPTAFVRAGSFLENYMANLGAAAATGWFDTFRMPTNRAFPMVATQDVGAEVARLLVGGWNGNPIVEIGLPFSPDDLALAMGEVVGREVRARAIPRDHWEAGMQAQGMPPGFIKPYLEMEDGFNSGWIDFGIPGTHSVAGTTTPAQVFAGVQPTKD